MEYITLPTHKLHEWADNWQTYSEAEYLLLKEKLEKKKQFKPLFVTPDEKPDSYTVLGGNKRLRAYKDLGVDKLWVSILAFLQKEDGLWYAYRDGIEETERFQTKEDAMRDWALVDNEQYGEMDWDAFANNSHAYQLDWSKYMLGGKPKRVSTRLNEFLMADKIAQSTLAECPSCHFVADKKDFKKVEGGETN